MQLNTNGAQVIEVSERTLGGEFNETLVHQAVVACMAGGRQGSKVQKTRSGVSGGGKKSWRQKGTGRVRASIIRSSIWRGGGTIFAAKPHSHEQRLNKGMYHAVLRSILTELVRLDHLVVAADFAVDVPKAKGLVAKLDTLGLKDVLIATDDVDENLYLAARNLAYVDAHDVQGFGSVSLVAYDKVLVIVSVAKKFEELLG